MVAPVPLKDLDRNIPITNPDGTPTPFFMQFLQERGTGQTGTATDVNTLTGRKINTSSPITGGGDLSADRTIGHAASGVTPGSYTNTNLTVDADGHITAASNGSGGSTPWDFAPPTAASMSLQSTDSVNLVLTDDADAGLLLATGAVPGVTRTIRMAYRTLTTKTSAWDMVVKMPIAMSSGNFKGGQLFMHDSVGGKVIEWGWRSDLTLECVLWSSLTGSPSRTTVASSTFRGEYHWWRIQFTGTTYNLYYGPDGKNWVLNNSFGTTAQLDNAADRVGFGLWFEGTDVSIAASVPYFSLTGPGV